MTDKQFLLAVLSDGREHRLSEILRRSFSERGCGMTVHSRAADLRRDGWDVHCWPVKGQRDSFYQLVEWSSRPLEEPASPLPPVPQPVLGGAGSSSGPEPQAGAPRDRAPALASDSTPSGPLTLFPTKRGAYDEPTAA